MEKAFIFGVCTALLLFAFFSMAQATMYTGSGDILFNQYTNAYPATDRVYDVGTPVLDSDGATVGYVQAVKNVICTNVTASTSYCDGNYCYADMPTADRVCENAGYAYAESYTYHPKSVTNADAYNITNWENILTDTESYAYGGSSERGPTGAQDTSKINAVWCCE